MSKIYAVYSNNVIENIIVAESKADAEFHTKMNAIEIIDQYPQIGWVYSENYGWTSPQPYPSWTWENNEWVAPIEMPNDTNYYWEWNEENMQWHRHPLPQPAPSWTLDENDIWQPPMPYPSDDDEYFWDEDSQSWTLV